MRASSPDLEEVAETIRVRRLSLDDALGRAAVFVLISLGTAITAVVVLWWLRT